MLNYFRICKILLTEKIPALEKKIFWLLLESGEPLSRKELWRKTNSDFSNFQKAIKRLEAFKLIRESKEGLVSVR